MWRETRRPSLSVFISNFPVSLLQSSFFQQLPFGRKQLWQSHCFFMEGDKLFSCLNSEVLGKHCDWPISGQPLPPPQSNPLWPSWREARLEGYTQVWPPVLPPQDGIGQTCLGKAFCFHLWQRPKINAGWLMSPYWAPAPNTCFLNKCTHEYYQLRVKL